MIAIQGYEGCFHQVAAQKFYGKDQLVEIYPCDSFYELIEHTKNTPEVSGAIMAIENSIAGGILPNYRLINESDLVIVGEVYLLIEQNLLVKPGTQLSDIKEVHSHPMALLQCEHFLRKHPWKLIESEDTALSAKMVATQNKKEVAAIASALCTELYDVINLVPSIQNTSNNYTRFLALQKAELAKTVIAPNKASLYFQTPNKFGALAQVLNIIRLKGVNLTNIQSFPVLNSDWHYGFFVDMEFEKEHIFNDLMEEMKPYLVILKILGKYKAGNHQGI